MLQPCELPLDGADLPIRCRMYFDPVNNLISSGIRFVANGVVPSRRRRKALFERRVNIDTPRKLARVRSTNTDTICHSQAAQTTTIVRLKIRTRRSPRTEAPPHPASPAIATASATALLANALNSPRPPHLASGSFSASGSRFDMSVAVPCLRSK